MELPIIIHQTSLGAVSLAAEDLAGWFDTGDETEKRPGYLRIIRPDGSARQILCYKTDGMLGDTGEGSPVYCTYTVGLYAPDPTPTALADTVVNQPLTEPTAAIFGILNEGTQKAYPIWKFTGPFIGPIVYNSDTDEQITLAILVPAGDYLIIDTRPSELRPTALQVYDNHGVNKISAISPTSKLWSFAPGLNHIIVNFSGGGTSVATTIQCTYLARYRILLR